jgi:hypothetical protein
VAVQNHVFLTSTLVGGEWSASLPGRFNPGKEPPISKQSDRNLSLYLKDQSVHNAAEFRVKQIASCLNKAARSYWGKGTRHCWIIALLSAISPSKNRKVPHDWSKRSTRPHGTHPSTHRVVIKQAVLQAHTSLMKGTNPVTLHHILYSARAKNTFRSDGSWNWNKRSRMWPYTCVASPKIHS